MYTTDNLWVTWYISTAFYHASYLKTLTPLLVRKTKPKSKLKQNLMNSSRTHLFYILAIIIFYSSTAETIRINMNIWKKFKVLILYYHISETWAYKRILILPFLYLLLYSQTWQEKGDCKTFTASKTIVTHDIINLTTIFARELYTFKFILLWEMTEGAVLLSAWISLARLQIQ